MKTETPKGRQIREQILRLTEEYYHTEHVKASYKDGDTINYGGRIYDEKELLNLVNSSLDFWLTTGPWTEKFEADFCNFLGVKNCSVVNSGSSANLLAFMALTSPKLKNRRILPNDEVITVAAGFPTTVTPIIQYGAVPVFIDITLPTYNIDIAMLEAALSSKTKAVMIAHTLGNPFDIKAVKDFCDSHNLWLIEDNCDALGAKYFLNGKWQYTGTFGDIATSSFYPPHHITMGEGGAVYTNSSELYRIVNSLRDWGRDCWCPSGHDNTCNCRFTQQFGELPLGYDHKYVYSHFGYNLKATDMQAAIGCAQLEKLPAFIEERRKNWQYLADNLKKREDYFILPEATANSIPSWFGFMLTIKNEAPFTRDDIVRHLENNKIQTRTLFAGNIIKHPCFDEMRKNKNRHRVIGDLKNTNCIMNNSFWVGIYPGINYKQMTKISSTILSFIGDNTK
ncbi:lipopolysaccharide biosynthesis protein RfbH [uncultured Cloacibacillus sp.]|uniref:lipopolysaccharide biosynthesis protein RfbH n=1 Tax=uncultured Cloacibacillus sp. TaxID=889794 RepID=UPI0027D9B805|nr:lipopolysaccharide biosynthesis protein RfbH [uncultured Cloacibacillus sp.]